MPTGPPRGYHRPSWAARDDIVRMGVKSKTVAPRGAGGKPPLGVAGGPSGSASWGASSVSDSLPPRDEIYVIRPAVKEECQVWPVGKKPIGPKEGHHPHFPTVINGPGMHEESGSMSLAGVPRPSCEIAVRRILNGPAWISRPLVSPCPDSDSDLFCRPHERVPAVFSHHGFIDQEHRWNLWCQLFQ